MKSWYAAVPLSCSDLR